MKILTGFILGLVLLIPVNCFSAPDQSEALSPEASRAGFVLPEGLHIQLVAAEPEVFDPVAMCFDESGNLYVVENRGYPVGDPNNPAGTVVLLRDKDGDGRFESRHVFAKDFDFPNGIMPWKGGVLLTSAPHVYFLKDTDGDDVADVRKIFLEGFKRGGSTQLYVSHPTLGIDNWLHFTNGLSGGTIAVPGHPEIRPLNIGNHDLRYNPITHELQTRAGRAQFGLTFDDFGHKFTCSNRNHLVHSVLEAGDLTRNPFLNASTLVQDIPVHGAASEIFALSSATTTAYAHEGTFTAACGLTVYRGTALPGAYLGNTFVCDPTGNLVHRDRLFPKGGTFEARRDPDETASEFLATTDEWSRPVFLTNGPDGALYLCDMYRKSIEHPTYLPDEIAAVTDFDAGKDMGRIYRITINEEYARPNFGETNTKALIAKLGHANGWHRDTAQRLLLQKSRTETDSLLSKSLYKSNSTHARVRYLNLLKSSGALTEAHILNALRDHSPEIREQALRLSRKLSTPSTELHTARLALANDPHPHVRFACALALGDIESPGADTLNALAQILRTDMDDPWTRLAVLSALDNSAITFAQHLLQSPIDDDLGWPDFIENLSRIIALSEPPAVTARYVLSFLYHPNNKKIAARLATLKGTLDGVQRNNDFPAAESRIEQLGAALPEFADSTNSVLHAWVQTCKNLLQSADSTIETKQRAIRTLAHTDFETAAPTLTTLLSPNITQQLQASAVTALNGFRHEGTAEIFLKPEIWLGFSPQTRKIALNGILATASGTEQLLVALEEETLGAWSIDPQTRSRLIKSQDKQQGQRAQSLFASLAKSDPAKRYEEYRDVLNLNPNPRNGEAVFKEICMGCHRYNDIGHDVGPDLTGIRSQSLESILLHIINPNRLMLSGYESYTIETRDGEVHIGLIASETATSVTLKQGLGMKVTVLRKDIAVLESSSLSMMPEELEAGMTRQELRDLLGFLKGESARSP